MFNVVPCHRNNVFSIQLQMKVFLVSDCDIYRYIVIVVVIETCSL